MAGTPAQAAWRRRMLDTDPLYHRWFVDSASYWRRRKAGLPCEPRGPSLRAYRAAHAQGQPLPRPALVKPRLAADVVEQVSAARGRMSRRAAAARFGLSPSGVWAIWRRAPALPLASEDAA